MLFFHILYNIIKLLIRIGFVVTIFVLIIAVYSMTMIMSKPRDIPSMASYFEEKIEKTFKHSEVRIPKASIIWDENQMSFNLQLEDVIVVFLDKKDEFIAKIPIIKIEISFYDIVKMNFKDTSILTILSPTFLVQKTENTDKSFVKQSYAEKNFYNSNFRNKAKEIREILLGRKTAEKFPFKKILVTNAEIINDYKTINQQIFINGNDKKIHIDKILIEKERIQNDILISANINIANKSYYTTLLENKCLYRYNDTTECAIIAKYISPEIISSITNTLNIKEDFSINILELAIGINKDKKNNTGLLVETVNGKIQLNKLFNNEIEFKKLSLLASIDEKFTAINLKKLFIDLYETKLEANILLKAKRSNDFTLDIKAKATNILLLDLNDLWPNVLGTHIKDWLVSNIKSGYVSEATLDLALTSDNIINHKTLSDKSLYSKITFSNIELDYANDIFPSVRSANGIAEFTSNDMNIYVEKAQILDTNIEKASVKIPEFHSNELSLEISGNVSGIASNIFDYINYHENNNKFSDNKKQKSEIQTLLEQIKINGNLSIGLPIKEHLELADIKIKAEGNLTNLVSNNLLSANSIIKLSMTKDYNSTKFRHVIDAGQSDVDIKKIGFKKPKNRKLDISFDFVINQLNNLIRIENINIIGDKKSDILIKGEIGFLEQMQGILFFNFSNIKFNGNDFKAFLTNPYKVRNGNLTAKDIYVYGNSISLIPLFTKNEEPKDIKKKYRKENEISINERFAASDIININISLNKIIGKNNISLDEIYGEVELVDDFLNYGHLNAKIKNNNLIDNKIDNFVNAKIVEDSKYYVLEGKKQQRRYKDMEDKIFAKKGSKIDKRVSGLNKLKESKLVIETSDIGSLASFAGISNNLVGGKASLKNDIIRYKNKDKEIKLAISGYLNASNITWTRKSFIQEIFRSFRSNDNLDKILFANSKGKFLYRNDSVQIENFSAIGNALGITMNGRVYLGEQKVKLEGLVIPAYSANNLFGIRQIPILGRLLLGKEGYGLISAAYEIVGNYSDQEKINFKIKPLSTIAPNFIKDLFDM